MESKVMCMMLEVNIAFHRLYLGDVVNKTCIIARPLPAGALIWPFWGIICPSDSSNSRSPTLLNQ